MLLVHVCPHTCNLQEADSEAVEVTPKSEQGSIDSVISIQTLDDNSEHCGTPLDMALPWPVVAIPEDIEMPCVYDAYESPVKMYDVVYSEDRRTAQIILPKATVGSRSMFAVCLHTPGLQLCTPCFQDWLGL